MQPLPEGREAGDRTPAPAHGSALPDGSGLVWQRCRLVAGHGVASGRAADCPYPGGSIAQQLPHFARLGLDLSGCHRGTLNLAFDGGRWSLRQPSWCFEALRWTDRHPPETFSFWPVLLRWSGAGAPVQGWLYRPHPETKRNHHQPPDRLEVLAPWIDAIGAAVALELGVDGRRCRLIQPARLQAQLLEFLKFRVLAAQARFFQAFEGPAGAVVLRRWLVEQRGPGATDLSDAELLAGSRQNRQLYVD